MNEHIPKCNDGYILNQNCKCVENKKTRKRCPNGTIKNKITGQCEPKTATKTANKTATKTANKTLIKPRENVVQMEL